MALLLLDVIFCCYSHNIFPIINSTLFSVKRNMSKADLTKRTKEKRQEAGRLLQLSVIVGSFLFGYLPRTGSIFSKYLFTTKVFYESFSRSGWLLAVRFSSISFLTWAMAASEPKVKQHEF